jgi:hypothetical protein
MRIVATEPGHGLGIIAYVLLLLYFLDGVEVLDGEADEIPG